MTAIRWLAMVICPPDRRAVIVALEDAQARAISAMISGDK